MTNRINETSELDPALIPHGSVEQQADFTRLSIPAGGTGVYRLSQLDDYSGKSRGAFPYRPPVSLSINCRVSGQHLPGTWGMGFWNDPFALGFGVQGSSLRFPTPPQAAWFFYGSQRNDLSFQSDKPANGLMASVFYSNRHPVLLTARLLPVFPLIMIKPVAREVRRLASRMIRDDFHRLEIDPTGWHAYRVDWLPGSVNFKVDEVNVFSVPFSPSPPLGLVIWIDNQYACFSSGGIVRYGTEENHEPAWMDIRDLHVSIPNQE